LFTSDDDEMDREYDPDTKDGEPEREEIPEVTYDDPLDKSPLIRPSILSQPKAASARDFDYVTSSTSQGLTCFETEDATSRYRRKGYLRKGIPVQARRPPATYHIQVLNDQVIKGPLEGQECPDFREGRTVYARDVGARRYQAMQCRNWRCLAKDPQHLREDGIDPSTLAYTIRRAQDVLDTLSLSSGRFLIKDKMHSKIVNYGKGSIYEKWPNAMRRLRELNFFQCILGDGWMSFDVEGIIDPIKQSFIDSLECTFDDTQRAFSIVHFGASNGAILQIQVNFNGCRTLGNDIPKEIEALLIDPDIYKCQYAVQDDARKLDSLNITVANCIDMRNVSMECFPQRNIPKVKDCRDGAQIGAEKLRTPIPFYTPSKKAPPKDGIAIHYESLDMTRPFGEWPPHWTYYNANDNIVVLALLDWIGVRCVQNEGLDMRADIGRHVRAYLARLRGKARYKDRHDRTEENSRPYDWMEGEIDTELGVQPMLGINPQPNISPAQLMSNIRSNKRHNIADKYQVSLDVLKVYENIMGSVGHGGERMRFEDWNLKDARDYSYREQAGGQFFPHLCDRCGSTHHRVGGCPEAPDAQCAFNLCNGVGHTITICPILNQTTCSECYYQGHDRQSHFRVSYERIRNEFQIAAPLGVISCRYLDNTKTYRMNAKTRSVDILEEEDPLAAPPSKRLRKEEVADHILKAIRLSDEKDKRL
jgi:hypothetical protein